MAVNGGSASSSEARNFDSSQEFGNINMIGFGISNYRSFSTDGVFFPELSKLNIFIGKNNSGKSNVLKFLRDLSLHLHQDTSRPLFSAETKHWGNGDGPAIDINCSLKDVGWRWESFNVSPHQHTLPSAEEQSFRIRYSLTLNRIGELDPFTSIQNVPNVYNYVWSRLGATARPPAKDEIVKCLNNQNIGGTIANILTKSFLNVFYVPQFREIRDGGSNSEIDHVGGYSLAQRLAQMKSPSENRNADQEQFYKIQEWIRILLDMPDLEIDFELPGARLVLLKADGLRRYLNSFGTGIHQLVILCFAISLKRNHIFCIEEPESFLHPTLQRRFMDFLRSTENTYFIATHSNVFLDAARSEDSTIYHVHKREKASTIDRIATTPDSYRVLEDLGYHASDILQSNGVIWVEGPTDRILLLKWLELAGSKAKEDTDFTIMFYGGRLLSHLSFDAEVTGELIPLLRLNRNAVVVLDSERTKKGQHLKKARRELISRIDKELSHSSNKLVWVTQGRDIENYISKEALERFAVSKWNARGFRLHYDSFSTLDTMLKWGKTHRKKYNYSASKVESCREIIPHIQAADLNVLDLKSKVFQLMSTIDAWCPKRGSSSNS